MRVILSDGRFVDVSFRLNRVPRGNHTTVCEVSLTMPDCTEPPWKLEGTAKCNHRDVYDKATGKVKALDRALTRMFPSMGQFVDKDAVAKNRVIRKCVWARFYQTIQTPDVALMSGYGEYVR